MAVSPPAHGRVGRLGALDALRFVAALSVVAFHFTMSGPAWDGNPPSAVGAVGRYAIYGTMGVSLFFVISGFVVLMTAWGRDVPSFVASRVGRLFPAYWAAVVIAAAISFVLWPAESTVNGHSPSHAGALLNLTMLQGATGTPDLNGAFWTLWTEARFYVILSAFLLVGLTRQRVLAFATLWPVLGAIVAHTHNSLLSTLLIADYAPYFAGGMLLYLIYRDGHDVGTWLLVGVQSLFAAVFAASHYPMSIAKTAMWPASQTVVAVLSFACFGLVALVTLTRLSRHSARWMTSLGALTYPLYLVHEKLGLYVIHRLHRGVSPWATIGAAALISLSLAIALHLAVEKPLGGWLRLTVLHTLRRSEADSAAKGAQSAVRPLTPFPRNPVAPNPMISSGATVRPAVRDVRAPLTASALD